MAQHIPTGRKPPLTSTDRLQVILLATCSCVLVKMPLDVSLLVIQRTRPNLKQAHVHSRTHLCQLDRLVSCLDKDMVADFDCVFDVFESNKSHISKLSSKCKEREKGKKTYVTTRFPTLAFASRGGKRCFRICTQR